MKKLVAIIVALLVIITSGLMSCYAVAPEKFVVENTPNGDIAINIYNDECCSQKNEGPGIFAFLFVIGGMALAFNCMGGISKVWSFAQGVGEGLYGVKNAGKMLITPFATVGHYTDKVMKIFTEDIEGVPTQSFAKNAGEGLVVVGSAGLLAKFSRTDVGQRLIKFTTKAAMATCGVVMALMQRRSSQPQLP